MAQPGGDDLEDALRAREIGQPVLAEVEERDLVGQGVAHDLLGGVRHHHLFAVGGGHDPGGPVGRGAVVVAVAGDRVTGVEAHPHPQPARHGPRLGDERPLGGERGVEGVAGGDEDRVEAVAGGLDHPAAVPDHRVPQDAVVALERVRHGARVLLPEPRGTLEIGEQERHRSRRQLRHGSPWQVAAGLPHDRTPCRFPSPNPVPGPPAAPPILDGMENGPNPSTERERVQPELVDGRATTDGAEAADAAVAAGDEAAEQSGEQVTSPTKLIRIASMVRNMLDEVRRAPLDDAGRRRLREIHERSLHELEGVLSPDLRQELTEVVLPFTSDAPSESELRLAQAQLVGWLEGLFHGIQATLFTQQATAQGQFEEMRRRALDQGSGAPTGPGPSGYL